MINLKKSIGIFILLTLIASCKSTSSNDSADDRGGKLTESAKESGKDALDKIDRVFFEFDSSNLTRSAKKTLKAQAALIISSSAKKVTVQGHCDERGSREYNAALGKRRAQATKDYLVKKGVDSKIIKIVSYGEDRPAANGTGEDVWSQNRRTVTVKAD